LILQTRYINHLSGFVRRPVLQAGSV